MSPDICTQFEFTEGVNENEETRRRLLSCGGAGTIVHGHHAIACRGRTSVGNRDLASTSPCTGGNNTSLGPGVQGTSAKGKGVVGQTKFNSTTSANGQNGILGQDLSTAGSFNTGVTGKSTRGTGVFGRGKEGVEGDNVGGNSDALFAKGHGGNLIRANSSVGRDAFVLDNLGNATFGGEVDADAVVAGLVNSALPERRGSPRRF